MSQNPPPAAPRGPARGPADDAVGDPADDAVGDPAGDPTGDEAFADVVTDDEGSPTHSLAHAPRRVRLVVLGVLTLVSALLFGVGGFGLVPGEAQWPSAVRAGVWAALVLAAALTVTGMLRANGRAAGTPAGDRWSRVAHVLLGVGWILFSWTLVTDLVLRLPLLVAGVENPLRSRLVAVVLAALVVAVAAGGLRAALRVPGVRRQEVRLAGLHPAFDGLTVAVVTDTHFDAFTTPRWSRDLVGVVNGLGADVVVHAGDLADGRVPQRRDVVEPLAEVEAAHRLYIAGNHEYYSDAPAWIRFMGEMGWTTLVNQHVVLERDGGRLVVAGLDDPTGTGMPGHGPSLEAALEGAPSDAAIVLLAHQPSQVRTVRDRVDLQISGHTHGGQIWPFHLLVRLREPVVQGLSRQGERTWLWTSRGSGFWGPPFRVLAPSEVSLLTLRAG